MQEAPEGYVESYSGISVTLKVTVERHAEESRNIHEQTLSFAIYEQTFSFLEAPKTSNHFGAFWGKIWASFAKKTVL